MKYFIIPESSYHRLKNKPKKVSQPEHTEQAEQSDVIFEQHKEPDDSFIIDAFPKTSKERAERLVTYIKRHDPEVTWSQNGIVTIAGKLFEGSNIIDLLRTAIHGTIRKPEGWTDFLEALKRINTPLSLMTLIPPGLPIKRPRWLTH